MCPPSPRRLGRLPITLSRVSASLFIVAEGRYEQSRFWNHAPCCDARRWRGKVLSMGRIAAVLADGGDRAQYSISGGGLSLILGALVLIRTWKMTCSASSTAR
jgi:hypothetical protein